MNLFSIIQCCQQKTYLSHLCHNAHLVYLIYLCQTLPPSKARLDIAVFGLYRVQHRQVIVASLHVTTLLTALMNLMRKTFFLKRYGEVTGLTDTAVAHTY